jgi:hypothetical protein
MIMSLNTSLHGLRALMAHPHHVELGVLGAAMLAALVWFEVRKPEAWLQWLILSMLMGPGFLFFLDGRGQGLDTSPFALGLAFVFAVGGGGLVTLRGIGRRERLEGLREAPAPVRHAPLNLGNG